MDWSIASGGEPWIAHLLMLFTLVGAVVLMRTVVAILYLPVHLSLNRRDAPMEARQTLTTWIKPIVRALLFVIALFAAAVIYDGGL